MIKEGKPKKDILCKQTVTELFYLIIWKLNIKHARIFVRVTDNTIYTLDFYLVFNKGTHL